MHLTLSVEETNKLRAQVGLRPIPEDAEPEPRDARDARVRARVEEARRRVRERAAEPPPDVLETATFSTCEWLDMMRQLLPPEKRAVSDAQASVSAGRRTDSVPQDGDAPAAGNGRLAQPARIAVAMQASYEDAELGGNLEDPLAPDPEPKQEAAPASAPAPAPKRAVFKPKRRKTEHARTKMAPPPVMDVMSYDELLEQHRRDAVDSSVVERARHEAVELLAEATAREDTAVGAAGGAKAKDLETRDGAPGAVEPAVAASAAEEEDNSVDSVSSVLLRTGPPAARTSARRAWLDTLLAERAAREQRLRELERKYASLPLHEREETMALHAAELAREQALRDRELLAAYEPDVAIEHRDARGELLTPKQAFKQLSSAFHRRQRAARR